MGRPPVHNPEVYAVVLDRMENGEFLREIEKDPQMPRAGWLRRKAKLDPDFGAQYARARELQAHAHAERAVQAARDATPETVAVARLQFDAERWIAGKLAPRDYGDRLRQEVTGADGEPVAIEVIRRVIIMPGHPDG